MTKRIVRLEDMPSVILENEVPEEILVPNPILDRRKVVITPEVSGFKEEQVFTSDCLPNEIPYKLLGIVEYPDGSYYPKYVANVVTSQELLLEGERGARNGVEVINKVAFVLTWQQGMIEAKSINRSDLKFLNCKREEISYWLASSSDSYVIGKDEIFGPEAVFVSRVYRDEDGTFASYGRWRAIKKPVRPTAILSSKIQRSRVSVVDL